MLAALALAWREVSAPALLEPGDGRAATTEVPAGTPEDGGRPERGPQTSPRVSAATASPEDSLRDAPADASFQTLRSLPPPAPSQTAPARATRTSAPSSTDDAQIRRRRKAARAPAARAAASTSAKATSNGKAITADASRTTHEKGRAAAGGYATSAAATQSRPQAAERSPRGASAARFNEAAAPAAHARRPGARFDLFSPTRTARERTIRERSRRPPRTRPPRIDRALGPRALRPPGAVANPSLAELSPRQPLAKPDGAPARWTEAPLTWLERVPTPADAACRTREGHWHREKADIYYHAGAGRGLAFEDAWLWLARLGRRWWALPDASRAPWLRHHERWWRQDDKIWYVLHEGEPWAWRHFARWEAEGLIHPASGTIIVYSADYARAAVLTPGDGAVLFDALTGNELARWSEEELPVRWRRAPESLSLPRGI